VTGIDAEVLEHGSAYRSGDGSDGEVNVGRIRNEVIIMIVPDQDVDPVITFCGDRVDVGTLSNSTLENFCALDCSGTRGRIRRPT
jgi:hypothetical protein